MGEAGMVSNRVLALPDTTLLVDNNCDVNLWQGADDGSGREEEGKEDLRLHDCGGFCALLLLSLFD
jgi:hypothetical protein